MREQENMPSSDHPKFLFDTDFAESELLDTTEAKAEAGATGPEGDETSGFPLPDQAAVEDGEAAPEATEPEPEPEPEPMYSETDLAQARDEGIKAGRDEALKDLEGSMLQKQSDTVEALSNKIEGIFSSYETDMDLHHRNSVSVAGVIVRKLFPALNNEKAIDEIDHIIDESMARTAAQAWLTFYVAEDLKVEVERLVTEKAKLSGRENVGLKVVGQPDIPLGDCRVEWEGGGMTRDQNEMWREIDVIIERNLGVLPQEVNEVAAGAEADVALDVAVEAETDAEAAVDTGTETEVETEAVTEAETETGIEVEPEVIAAPVNEQSEQTDSPDDDQAGDAPTPPDDEDNDSEDDPKTENPE